MQNKIYSMCPVCGGKPKLQINYGAYFNFLYISCQECGLTSDHCLASEDETDATVWKMWKDFISKFPKKLENMTELEMGIISEEYIPE